MPLYEGIGLISDKHAVVLDIGTAYTKCGFAGETGPRCIIPSSVKCSRTGKLRKICEYENKDDLYQLVVDFVHYLYFRHLLVNPKDRRVVILESLLCPTLFRETLAKALFRHYEVSSVLFAPSHLVALCTLGINTALVLDVGYQEAVLIPVYEGVPVLHAWQAQPLAGQVINSTLESLLLEQAHMKTSLNDNVPLLQIPEVITEKVLEDIKVRTCFCTTLERGLKLQAAKLGEETIELPAPPVDVAYPLDGERVITIPGRVRESVCEVLFEQDNDMMSVSTMVLDAILKCPIDMRRTLAENLLVIGGTASLCGFKARLLQEIKHLVNTPKYKDQLVLHTFKFHKPPAKDNYVVWLGGGIFGATDVITTRSLPKEFYLKNNYIPDWANLRHNTKDEEKTV